MFVHIFFLHEALMVNNHRSRKLIYKMQNQKAVALRMHECVIAAVVQRLINYKKKRSTHPKPENVDIILQISCDKLENMSNYTPFIHFKNHPYLLIVPRVYHLEYVFIYISTFIFLSSISLVCF